jgi:hypothetical protein
MIETGFGIYEIATIVFFVGLAIGFLACQALSDEKTNTERQVRKYQIELLMEHAKEEKLWRQNFDAEWIKLAKATMYIKATLAELKACKDLTMGDTR